MPQVGASTSLPFDEQAKLVYGVVFSLRNMCRKLSGASTSSTSSSSAVGAPSPAADGSGSHDAFSSYTTPTYTLTHFQSPTMYTFVLFTDPLPAAAGWSGPYSTAVFSGAAPPGGGGGGAAGAGGGAAGGAAGGAGDASAQASSGGGLISGYSLSSRFSAIGVGSSSSNANADDGGAAEAPPAPASTASFFSNLTGVGGGGSSSSSNSANAGAGAPGAIPGAGGATLRQVLQLLWKGPWVQHVARNALCVGGLERAKAEVAPPTGSRGGEGGGKGTPSQTQTQTHLVDRTTGVDSDGFRLAVERRECGRTVQMMLYRQGTICRCSHSLSLSLTVFPPLHVLSTAAC